MQVHPNFLNRYYQDKRNHKHLVLIQYGMIPPESIIPYFSLTATDYDITANRYVSTGYNPALIHKLVPELDGASRWQLWTNSGLPDFIPIGLCHAGFYTPTYQPNWQEFYRHIQLGWRVGDGEIDFRQMNFVELRAWLKIRLGYLLQDFVTDMDWIFRRGTYQNTGLKLETVAEVSLT